MNDILKNRIILLDRLFKIIEIDYQDLKNLEIDEKLFENIEESRIISSFLFNFLKIQDMLGAKFFKELLYELKEIEEKHLPMLDILYKLERLNIITNIEEWDEIREVRNFITHEYPLNESRINTLKKALVYYPKMKKIYFEAKNYLIKKGLI